MNEPTPKRAALAREVAFARIRAAVGEKGCTTDPAEMAPRLRDERGLFVGNAAMLVRPANTAETAAVVGICNESRIPIVPQGGNTGLVGGSTPDIDFAGIVLATGRMNRVRAVDAVNNTLTAEAGCILADLQRIAAEMTGCFR